MKYIPYILIASLALLTFTGFIVDEGGQIEARQEATAIAQDAARAGTDAASGTAVNGDAFQIAGPTALAAVRTYLAAAGPDTTGTARVEGDEIIVTVHRTYRTRFAGLLGITRLDATGIAAARLIDTNQ